MIRYVIFFVFVIVFSVFDNYTANSQEDSNPEYLIMITDMEHPGFLGSSKVYISINGEAYKEKKIPNKKVQGKYDYNPLINMIREYNKLGWEIINSNLSFSSENSKEENYLFIMMRRDEPYEIDHTPKDTIIEKPERAN